MSPREKVKFDRIKVSPVSIALYAASIIAAVIAVASLVITITFFNYTVSQYVAQGYTASDVYKQLLPSQLYPGILQGIAIYGGIAVILFGLGKINQNSVKHLVLQNRTNIPYKAEEENTFENDALNLEHNDSIK